MENKKLLTAIVALLIVTSIASISTISVSAVHTETPSIDKSTLQPGTPMIRTITVNHLTGDPIDNVRIIFPTTLTSSVKPVKTVPENENVRAYGDNIVVLPAGTAVQLLDNENVILAENTDVLVAVGKSIYYPINHGTTTIQENSAKVEVTTSTVANMIPAGDNIKMTKGLSVYLNNENKLRLVSDTLVMLQSDNIMRLPENTMMELVAANDNGISALENVMNKENATVVLNDNHMRMVTNKPANSQNWNILTGDNVELVDKQVIIPIDTIVQLSTTVGVRMAENTEVIREDGKDIDISGADVENEPNNWMQSTGVSTLPPGNYVEWVGIGDNHIASPLDFPIAFTTTTVGDNYTIRVQTTDIHGSLVQMNLVVSIDNVAPTVTVTASPTWVKENTAITITVTASEVIADLENAWVAENNAPENTAVPLSTSDNITWTGTYTTGDNSDRDGTVTVYVVGSEYEDSVGNGGSNATTTFTIDRMAPPTPLLTAITGLPTSPTNIGGWLIQGTAQDNFLGNLTTQAGMTVKIRNGTTITSVTTDATGYFSASITLNQGEQELGIQYTDKAGNVGDENAENVTYDNIAPVITPSTISGKAFVDEVLINDSTPTVKLSITDATLGIENAAFDNLDNSGYTVELQDENGVQIGADLTNATPPTENMPNTISFENTVPTALDDGIYQIFVVAGDNLQMDNLVITFEIDTTPPAAPVLNATASPNALAPDIKKTTTTSIGGTGEPGATLRIWTSSDPFTTEVNVENVVVDSDGNWTATLTLPQGVTVRIKLSQVDIAGNESTKVLYGYLKVDASAPVVQITSPATGTKTDKTTVTVTGTVTKDAWELWTDITLRLQNGVSSTSIVIPVANDGTFSVNVTLGEGKNTIIATATDSVGNYGSDQVTVERTVTSWAIYAIILVIIALVLAAIAIFRMR